MVTLFNHELNIHILNYISIKKEKQHMSTVQLRPSKYPHVYWIDLHNNGVMHEVVVVARDANENIWFIPLNALDAIDKRRMLKLVMDRSANLMPLYDVMFNSRLGNGCNALEYFNQLTKLRTPNGQIFDVRAGVIGSANPIPTTQPETTRTGPVVTKQ